MLVFKFFSLFVTALELVNFATFYLVESTLSKSSLLNISFLVNYIINYMYKINLINYCFIKRFKTKK
jgi:hypothetical protein